MDRRQELGEIFKGLPVEKKAIIEPLLDDFVFIEEHLRYLKKLPQIRVHPKNPARQEVTPAGKQYKEYMQSYINALKVLQKTLDHEEENAESPLLKALKEFENE